ncbi:MAG: methyltransferase domain-containing protein [Hyphomicrobiales bacterium]|nr:methyltransferase domain-containing protein [Hyphomicrobiales bacterium]
MNAVTRFYENHPINEQQILDKLAAEGIPPEKITPQDLSRFDQDHYGGLDATDRLAETLDIAPGMTVLDVCSGMGGTSRYLAYRYGANVVGMDLTESRVEGARSLTEIVGMQDSVRYVVGDASDMQLDPDSFDRLVSQEAFLHIPNREPLFACSYRVLKRGGGIGFTDWIAKDGLSVNARQRFADGFAARDIASLEQYRNLVTKAGFVDVAATDLSVEWREILGQRLEMYRSLEAETIAQFGQERFNGFVDSYVFFIEQIDAGTLVT